MKIETLNTDILILGAGGAGLLAALHAQSTSAQPRHHRRGQRAARPERLHAHGARRLQLRPQSRRLLRPTLRRHDQRRRVPQQPGARLGARHTIRPSASSSSKTASAACSTAIPTARSTRSRSPASPSTAPCTRGDLTGIEIMSNLRDYVLESRTCGPRGNPRPRSADGRRSRHAARCCSTTAAARSSRCSASATLLATGGGARCTASRRRRSKSPATAWRWRGAPAPRSSTWRCCSSTPPACWSATRSPPAACSKRACAARARGSTTASASATWSATIPKLERATRDVVSRSSYMEIMAGRGTPAAAASTSTHATWARTFLLAELPRHGRALRRLRLRPGARPRRSLAQRALPDGRRPHRRRLPHLARRPVRRRRGRRRRPRRQSPRRQRRRRLDRLRRARRRRACRSRCLRRCACRRPKRRSARCASAGARRLRSTGGEHPNTSAPRDRKPDVGEGRARPQRRGSRAARSTSLPPSVSAPSARARIRRPPSTSSGTKRST